MNRQRTHLSGARQQGAALYVALMMLILLALISLVGMQVAGMQERMASAYRAANLAFQNAEAYVRQTECGLERLNGVPDVPASNCALVSQADIQTHCDDGFDVGVWAQARSLASGPARNIRQIEGCIIGQAEIGMGGTQEQGGGLQPIYQITVYQTDTGGGADPSSGVVIDTIFKL